MTSLGAKDIQKRRLGDKDVFPVGFGAMGLSTAYGTASTNDEERLKVSTVYYQLGRKNLAHAMPNKLQFLDAVYASGVNHWDTADVYKDSEDLLGKW